jgi:uncharacterized delta-60 repeat protein
MRRAIEKIKTHTSQTKAAYVVGFTSLARATSKATKKATLLLFSVAVLLAGSAAAVRGQSALDGFDPNANGAVRIVVVQPDGKILIGGEFTTLSPNGGVAVTRNHIARLNPDGTLDTAFNPNANNFVLSIAVQANGKILAGGTFAGANSIGGQTRNNIARLDAVTGLADSFDPNANGFVQGIAVQADGKILAGGAFTSIGGQTRSHMARLDAVTGLADSFDPNANIIVRSIVVQTDGKILAGGEFTSIGGQTRNNIARLDAVTGLADSFDPNANGFVRSIAVQTDGRVVAGGGFTSIGGQARNSIARLDAVTGLADSFNPNANNVIRAVAVQADGRVLAGGDFTSIGGQTRNNIARLDAVTGLADSFDPNANGSIRAIAVQADGKILAGGLFTTLAPNGGATVTRNNIARLVFLARPATLGNISTRLPVGAGDRVLIAGFIVQGSSPKKVLIRAAGPSLTQFGVPNALPNPRLELHDTNNTIGTNDDWQTTQIGGVITSDQVAEIQSSGLAPRDPAESVIIATLPPGSYTAIVQGVSGGTGVGIVETYDLDATSGSLLANISTRGFVQTGDNTMIGGFIVVTQPTRVIIRAIGPSLTQFGVPDALANPQLELHDATSTIAQNNDWQTTQIGGIITSDQVAEIQNSQLAPTNPAESAIIGTLQPGSYTAIVRGVNNTTGNGLVEVYSLP